MEYVLSNFHYFYFNTVLKRCIFNTDLWFYLRRIMAYACSMLLDIFKSTDKLYFAFYYICTVIFQENSPSSIVANFVHLQEALIVPIQALKRAVGRSCTLKSIRRNEFNSPTEVNATYRMIFSHGLRIHGI